MSKTVIEQAIEALNSTDSERGSEAWEREKEAMIALEKLAEQPAPAAQGEPSRYQELREVLENLMSWQVKNVDKWHNGAYDQASKVLKRHNAAPQAQPAREPLTDEQIDAEFEVFASRYDCESNEYQDMGSGEYFRAGFKAAHNIKGIK